MLFTYKNIDFDINENEMSKEEVIEMFEIILKFTDLVKVNIIEINVESEEYATMFIEGDLEDTIKLSTILYAKLELETSDSDEDYGEGIEVLNLYLDTLCADCGACSHFDGSICMNAESPYYGREGDGCQYIE